MAWDSGTIASSTPWTALSQKIKNLVGGAGVANWSFVENIPAGTGTGQSGSGSYSVDIFKCAGSGTNANDAGVDFYFGLQIPIPDGAVGSSFGACEDYEGGTNKRVRHQCPTGGSSAAPVGTGYWRTDTYASWSSVTGGIGLGWLTSSLGTFALNTTGFSYWIKLTPNFILVAARVGSTEAVFCITLLDSVITLADTIPLYVFHSGGGAGISNLPGVTDSTNTKWTCHMRAWTTPVRDGLTSNTGSNYDFWQNNKIYVSRVAVFHRTGSVMPTCGGIRGLLKKDILCFSSGGTVNLGDTMVINGVTYTVVAPAANYAAIESGGSSTIHLITTAA